MQFGADQSSEVQWLSCMVLSSAIQGSAFWWSQAQTKTVQSSEVQCRPVQSSEVLSGSVQSSPVQSTDVRSSPFSKNCARPVQFQFIPFQLSTFQSSVGQVHTSQQQSSLVQSIAVQSSAIRNSSAQSRPVQSRTTNCRWVQHNAVPLSLVRNTQVHCSPSRQLKCYSEKSTLNPIQAYFSPVLSSVVTPTQSRASTYGIVVDRSFLMIP